MLDFFDMILNHEKLLTFSNFVLASCIVFHLICEFTHYIHEFISRRKDGKKLTKSNELLEDVLERVENLEKVHAENMDSICPLKENGEEDYVAEKVYVKTNSAL